MAELIEGMADLRLTHSGELNLSRGLPAKPIESSTYMPLKTGAKYDCRCDYKGGGMAESKGVGFNPQYRTSSQAKRINDLPKHLSHF